MWCLWIVAAGKHAHPLPATAGHHLTSMRWPVVMPPPAHSATRKEVPLRAFTLGVVPLDLARLGIVATVETDGRGALTLKGGR